LIKDNVHQEKVSKIPLLLDLCKGNNFFILNARLDGDKHGNYTCKNVSVVDYCICNASFVNIKIKEITVSGSSAIKITN
jgi:hypothetical protein